MAWPFSNVVEPNFDTGMGEELPMSAAEIAGGSLTWILGAHLVNTSPSTRTVTVTDSAGNVLYGPKKIPAGGDVDYTPPFEPTTGIKWSANGAGVTGHIWGYQ